MKLSFVLLFSFVTFYSSVSASIDAWDASKDYNIGVTVVVNEGANAGSYRSIKSVPANQNIDITNTEYWFNLFLEANLPDYVQAGVNPDEEGLTEALSSGTPDVSDIPAELPPDADNNGGDTSTGGGDTSTGGGDTSTGGGDTSTGGGDTSTGGGDTSTGGGDTSTGGGDTSTGGGDTSTGGGDTSTGGGDTSTGGGNTTVTARLLGISTRGPVSKTVGMTGAVAVTGSGTKKVAFMAKGTTMLATDATINVVKDPKMIIYQNDGSGWSVLGENDNHADASSSQNISTVSGKEGITLPSGANEAAIVVDVQPGVSYAAIVTEQDTTIGDNEVREAIVEAYEISEDGSTSQARFLGISTRGPISKTVGMTGAVAVTGTGAKKVAFMAKGTTMLATDATINVVKDPKMIIYQNDGSGWTVLGENDNHADASSSQNISTVSGKEGITLPSGANEAAIVVDVQPGVSYAAIVTEQDTTIGDNEVREAIVEAYEITE